MRSLKNLAQPITILGIPVTQDRVVQLASLMGASIASGILQFIGIA